MKELRTSKNSQLFVFNIAVGIRGGYSVVDVGNIAIRIVSCYGFVFIENATVVIISLRHVRFYRIYARFGMLPYMLMSMNTKVSR